MRFLRMALLASLITAVWLPAATHAGQREGAFSLSPVIGYHVFEGDQKTDDAVYGGLSFGYNVSKRWAAELELRYTSTEFEGTGDTDFDIASGGINALYHFNPDGPLVPYATAGFGIMSFSNVSSADDDQDFMMNWGLGAKYFFREDMALRVEVRHLLDLHSDRVWDQGTGDDIDNNLLASAGLSFQFGGPTTPPPAPLDSDRDGIPDVRDKCPDTPLGVLVDAVGCPPVEKAALLAPEKVVDGDDDQDGVPNSRDKCPGTEKGVIVDADGCPVQFTLKIEFDFDKSMVRPEYHDDLRQAAAFISKHPEAQFLLAGHTDSIGTDQYNMGLSKRRAAAVKKYLVEEFGIAAQLLHPRGYGEKRPVATNETAAGRQENRRVEVICCVLIPPE
ncbi:MAG: OmpA family protein [Desulfuromonadales bacterium]